MSIHEQARAEAEKRMPGRLVELVGDLEYNVQAARMRKAFVEGAVWAATRTRVVTTVTELDALAERTCIVDADMEFHQRHGSLLDRTIESAWLGFLSPTLRSAGELRLPARVLYDPEEDR